MNWEIKFLPDALTDIRKLDKSQQILVNKALKKVSTNPLPQNEGGYGKPLGNKNARNLSGLLKIKLKDAGIRIVYKLIHNQNEMFIIVVATRVNDTVYDLAKQRIAKYFDIITGS
jgi:mRNA interferase RelE/StbE